MKNILTILTILSSIVSYSFAMTPIESINSLTTQEQKEYISKSESITDQRNTKLNKEISRYSTLLPILETLKYTPESFFLYKGNNEEYLEIGTYSFIPKKFGSHTKVGQRVLVVRLYYDANQTLTRVQTKYTKQNFDNQQTSVLILDDMNPSLTANSSHNHIKIKHMKSVNGLTNQKNIVELLDTTFGEMKNTFDKPFRNEIKYAFYNVHLNKIVRNLQDTSVLNIKFNNTDAQISKEELMKVYPKYGM